MGSSISSFLGNLSPEAILNFSPYLRAQETPSALVGIPLLKTVAQAVKGEKAYSTIPIKAQTRAHLINRAIAFYRSRRDQSLQHVLKVVSRTELQPHLVRMQY